MYEGDIASILISEEQIEKRTANWQWRSRSGIPAGAPEGDLLLVGVLKGAIMFMTDFARALPIPTQIEFMAVSSYGSSTSSSGVVRILKDLDQDIAGRHVLIVEDIIDSGLTLSWLMRNLATRKPASLEVVTLLRKPDAVQGRRRGSRTSASTSPTSSSSATASTTTSATATCRTSAPWNPGLRRLSLLAG